MKTTYTNAATLMALVVAMSLGVASAILVQPYNYLLDDSGMVGQHDQSGSLSPFYNDQHGSSEQTADKDIVSIIGDGLNRLRFARMMDNQEAAQQQGHFSQEMAELIQSEQQEAKGQDNSQEPSLSSSVASMLLNVAQAAAQASAPAGSESQLSQEGGQSSHSGGSNGDVAMSSRGNIMELDTSASSSPASASSLPSKADLKSGPIQWFNPKETIPVLKISSMATPSKYKKVYFRSEKKLVDGAFHSPTSEHDEKKSLMKTFNSGVQRRSSRGTSSSVAPPSILQDGVIDFLKKFRDVYIQTRPVSTASSASNLASSMVSAAASSPLASILAPSSSSGSRPNLVSALSAATSMLGQAASAASSLPAASSSGSAAGAGSAVAAAGAAGAAGSPIKSPLTAQSYVSFWSKTFPTWVRKMLKQLRRRSLHNSSKRHQAQHHHHHSASSAIGQAAQAAASSVVESASSGGSSSSSQSAASH